MSPDPIPFDAALRITAIAVGLAVIQQSIEHAVAPRDEQLLYAPRALAAFCLVLGWHSALACGALVMLHLLILRRFEGPYNGGSDRMSLLGVSCLALAYVTPNLVLKETALGYLAVQGVLSYTISGWVKLVNPEWRNGRALRDVFEFSAYPVSESLRGWAKAPRVLRRMGWAVMLFELLFPFALASRALLIAALAIGAAFHVANACLFGLNRFVWIWLATYPSLLWLQGRVF